MQKSVFAPGNIQEMVVSGEAGACHRGALERLASQVVSGEAGESAAKSRVVIAKYLQANRKAREGGISSSRVHGLDKYRNICKISYGGEIGIFVKSFTDPT